MIFASLFVEILKNISVATLYLEIMLFLSDVIINNSVEKFYNRNEAEFLCIKVIMQDVKKYQTVTDNSR